MSFHLGPPHGSSRSGSLIRPPLPLRTPRLVKDQAGFGLAQIHDLQRRVVINNQWVFAAVLASDSAILRIV